MSDDTDTAGAPSDADSPTASLLLAEAALRIAAAEGWSAVTVSGAAEQAGLDRVSARRTVRCKAGLLVAIAERVDGAMIESLDEDATDPSIPVRDRLFEALMARLDVLSADREAFVSILRGLPRDPATALASLPSLGRSMARTLQAVGERSWPPFGPLKVKGLAIVWLATLRTWQGDDSPDLAVTMKALDGYLARAEEMANTFLPGVRRVNGEASAPESA